MIDVGGRGSSSGKGSSSDKASSSGSFSFQHDKSVQNLDQRVVSEFEQAIHDVLSDFGLPDDTVTRINGYILKADKRTLAAANGLNQIGLNPEFFSDYSKASKFSNDGYTIADGIVGTATHETGHVIANQILKMSMPGAKRIDIETAKKNGKIEKKILLEAKKRFGSNPPISPYGSTKFAEKVAEAVSDVYTNGKKANPYSKVIVEVMKDMLKKNGKG